MLCFAIFKHRMDKVENNLKVSISYTLKDLNGRIIEEIPEKHPFVYLHGFNNIILGLEEALNNRKIGDFFSVKVPFEKAYGAYNKEKVLEVSKIELIDIGEIWLGLELEMFQEEDITEFQIPEYPEQIYSPTENLSHKEAGVFIIKEIKKDTVVLDGNHPFAGMDLFFEVRVLDIQEPDFNELESGIPNELLIEDLQENDDNESLGFDLFDDFEDPEDDPNNPNQNGRRWF